MIIATLKREQISVKNKHEKNDKYDSNNQYQKKIEIYKHGKEKKNIRKITKHE